MYYLSEISLRLDILSQTKLIHSQHSIIRGKSRSNRGYPARFSSKEIKRAFLCKPPIRNDRE